MNGITINLLQNRMYIIHKFIIKIIFLNLLLTKKVLNIRTEIVSTKIR